MHGTIMVFFFISYVLVSGFGNYLVPLQIGAEDMAFPFLNMLSYWIAVLSRDRRSCLSFLAEGGAAASGWTAYPPLSAVASAVPGLADGPDPVAAVDGAVHRLLHDERPEHRRHGAVPPRAGHAYDASCR